MDEGRMNLHFMEEGNKTKGTWQGIRAHFFSDWTKESIIECRHTCQEKLG